MSTKSSMSSSVMIKTPMMSEAPMMLETSESTVVVMIHVPESSHPHAI